MRIQPLQGWRRLGILAVLVAVVGAAIPAVVSAAKSSPTATTAAKKAAHGVRPTSPKNGAVIPRNTFPTFKARVRGKGTVFIRVCTSKKRDVQGQLCKRGGDQLADISRAKKGKKKGRSRVRFYKPDRFTFPDYYLQKPGVYYWQMYRIDCVRTGRRGRLDCIQEGPTRKFTVR